MDRIESMPETSDVLKFADDVIEDVVKHVSDDGKIDGFEITQTVLENTPGAIKAGVGASKILEEYQSAPSEDQEKMFAQLSETLLKIAGVFMVKE